MAMKDDAKLWPWIALTLGLLAALGLLVIYAWLPVDGTSGDLDSFRPDGFHVKWLLGGQAHQGGLQVGDVIVRAGGYTVDEWLGGAPRGPEWQSGSEVVYEIVRDRQPLTIKVRLAPVPFGTIVGHWGLQFMIALAILAIGLFILVRRPQERAARFLMLFCTTFALQYWGDAWNIQFATLPWRWPLWLHVAYEHGVYGLTIATVLIFALIFPLPHPIIRRHPYTVLAVIYATYPVHIAIVMALAGGGSRAMQAGNIIAWAIALAQIILAIAAGVRSARRADDPVARAQVRWIVWWSSVGFAVIVPGYLLPAMLGRPTPIPHPAVMILVILIPLTLAIAILRYRLFDIRVVIQRVLVYGTLSILLAGLYLALVRLFTLIIPAVLHRQDDATVIFIATLSIAMAFDPLRWWVQRAIDRTFFRAQLDYGRLLPELSARLATSLDLEQVAVLLAGDLPRRLKIAWAALAVLDLAGEQLVPVGAAQRPQLPSLVLDHPLAAESRRLAQPIVRLQPPPGLHSAAQIFLDQYGIELCIPLLAGANLMGIYCLGPLQSGDAYPRDQVGLFHLLGQQAAAAVQNSRLFQAEHEQRQRAEALLEEKEVLLQEIHHRVKNNLQVISSLLYLQSRHIQDPATLEMFLESQRRVRSMALIHETLYQAGDLARVNCDEYVRELASYLHHAFGVVGRVRLRLDVTDVWLGIDTAVPCGLIINELISNALKHAFPDGREGEVSIHMARDPADGIITLTVADDGVGLPEALDPQAAPSLGLQLVHRLAHQIGASIDVETSPGMVYTLKFSAVSTGKDPGASHSVGVG